MFALAQQVGRQRAHDVVHACAMDAYEQERSFSELLAADPLVAQHLSPARITELLDPTGYTGLATHFVDQVLAAQEGPEVPRDTRLTDEGGEHA